MTVAVVSSVHREGGRAGRALDLLVGMAVAMLEIGLLITVRNLALLIVLHLIVVIGLGAWVWLRSLSGGDTTTGMLMLLGTAAIGPIGTLGALVTGAVARPGRGAEPELLAEWYDRIALSTEVDPVTRLCEQVAAGRAVDLSEHPPASFVALMAAGSQKDRQAVLGLIARRFNPIYLPVLAMALKSPDAVVRVQAAAVAARVKGDVERTLSQLIEAAGLSGLDADRRLAIAAELELIAGSSICDTVDRTRAYSAIDRLLGEGRGTLEQRMMSTRSADGPADVLVRDYSGMYERYLLRAGAFAELRQLRARRRIAAIAPRARVRRLGIARVEKAAGGCIP